jgi:hypothetical protein
VNGGETTPPSRISSEGGDWGWRNNPSVSHFRRGSEEGVDGGPSRITSDGGGGSESFDMTGGDSPLSSHRNVVAKSVCQ